MTSGWSATRKLIDLDRAKLSSAQLFSLTEPEHRSNAHLKLFGYLPP